MSEALLKRNQHHFGDVFDFKMDASNVVPLDLSKRNPFISTEVIESCKSQEKFVFDQIKRVGGRVGAGGYLEDRKLYQRGTIFDNNADARSIHLGVDLWIEAGTSVFAPLDGRVFSVKDNAGTGDYGPTIILKHELEGTSFFTLYGHLNLSSLKNLQVGDAFSKGQKLCEIGNYPENGEWAPHLHFQVITNLDDFNDGDYPAVVTEKDKLKYSKYCPNPNLILCISNLDD